MRISDWSSDVCSSDLAEQWRLHARPASGAATRRCRRPVALAGRRGQHRGVPGRRPDPPRGDSLTGADRMKPSIFLSALLDRKSVVSDKRVSVLVALGGRRSIKKKAALSRQKKNL